MNGFDYISTHLGYIVFEIVLALSVDIVLFVFFVLLL